MAKTLYQRFQEEERQKAAEELKRIIDKPTLEPNEIWEITPENFIQWRKKHDYPRILKHFSEKLTDFEKWKSESKLTDELLMAFGISNCINPNPSKDKRKFIVQNQNARFISYQSPDSKYYNLGKNPGNHKIISTFLGYIDWCDSKQIKIMKDWRDNGIISRPSKSHPVGFPPANRVDILDGLELLKIGGLEVQSDQFELIKPKHFEFVNADYLKLSGRLSTQGRRLIFENSFVDNLICDNLDIAFISFNNCSVTDLYSINSTFEQWNFNFSNVNGKAYNTDLKRTYVYGGHFMVDFTDCTFDQVDARQSSNNDLSYENTYRSFKKIYADQGDDKKAIEYFLLEKSMERQRIRKEIFQTPQSTFFKKSKGGRILNNFIYSFLLSLKYLFQCLNNFYWGYGRKPLRVVRNSIGLIVLFSLIYFLDHYNIHMPQGELKFTFFDSLYYSAVTFTTLGYGDFTPLGFLRLASAIEACLGGLSFGFLVAAFSNFKY